MPPLPWAKNPGVLKGNNPFTDTPLVHGAMGVQGRYAPTPVYR